MKTDLYTKVILTVIACCLTFNVMKEVNLIPDVYAGNNEHVVPVTSLPPASLLKTNEDGSLNVRLTASSVMEVKPAYGARFTIEPSSGSEFKVKPVSYQTSFYVKNSDSEALYVRPYFNAVFDVRQRGGSTNSSLVQSTVSTFAYPNPANDKIKISYSVSTPDEYITICSINGKTMDYLLLDSSQNELVVDLSKYPSGAYVYNFSGNAGKFIVSK